MNRCKRSLLAVLWPAVSAMALAEEQPPQMPMPVAEQHTTTHRWLQKKVLKSRLLDDMESLDRWKMSFWSQGKGEIALTDQRSVDGRRSLRLRSQTKGEKPSPDGGVFGSTAAVRVFDGENWNDFNRLSFRVFPSLPGFHAVALSVRLGNRGKPSGRDTHHFLLENDQWNHVVWEIPDLARDQVTEVAFNYVMNGNERNAADVAQFDIDRLELQQVEADHYEGWNAAPGRIAFSHTGYPTGGPKTAVSGDPAAGEFQLIRQESGQPVFTKPIETVQTGLGRFAVMDFSEFKTPGAYTIRAGKTETLPFAIDDDVWNRTIWKAINFFYVERCGDAIPGVHDVCHADWQSEHQGKRITINGGWHDAGDLSQGLINTSEAVYAMFALAEKLRSQDEHAALRRRLVEEARWGLDWVMKTSFHDGHRVQWATMRFWTNGILGDLDDVTAKAQRDPAGSFYAAACEAIAYRILKQDEPELAEKALKLAVEDWQFAAAGMEGSRPEHLQVEHASIGALASLELLKATGQARYGEKARELGRVIVQSQQKDFLPGLKIPLTGFFYRSPRRQGLLHYMHRGHEQAPVVAAAMLCEAFPDHEDWIQWYAVAALYSEYYQKAMAKLTSPYRMLPNSIHRLPAEGIGNPDAREQIANGFDVGGGYRVRVYPVQPAATFRGNYGTLLSQAKGVAAAAHLRGDPELAGLCQEQLYWIVGRNPFGQSTMYGEGYDYAPQYTARSGDIVGSLPVGMKSLGNRDLPYWPATNVWNYKEVWVHPVSRWIWLMCDLEGPAIVRGRVQPGGKAVTFTETTTGTKSTAKADVDSGRFTITLASGVYRAQSGGGQTVSLLPGRTYDLDLRPEKALGLKLTHQREPDGRVTITLEATGTGTHEFAVRSYNLDVPEPKQAVTLKPDGPRKLQWTCAIRELDRPWIVVIIPNADFTRRVEAIGSERD